MTSNGKRNRAISTTRLAAPIALGLLLLTSSGVFARGGSGGHSGMSHRNRDNNGSDRSGHNEDSRRDDSRDRGDMGAFRLKTTKTIDDRRSDR